MPAYKGEDRTQVVDLDEVMKYYAKGFTVPDGYDKIYPQVEYLVDIGKRKVVFLLTIGKLIEPE